MLLGEFPFLKSGRFNRFPKNDVINMSLAWLLIADDAIQLARYSLTIVAKLQVEGFRIFFAIIREICWLTENMGNKPPSTLTWKPSVRVILLTCWLNASLIKMAWRGDCVDQMHPLL